MRGDNGSCEQYPFVILGLHFDNGSEFINYRMRELLEKLAVEFTKSRALHSTDNALVEGKNGAIIRKGMGYGHIPGEHAPRIQDFYIRYFNPYLNFHRPCGFATVTEDAGESGGACIGRRIMPRLMRSCARCPARVYNCRLAGVGRGWIKPSGHAATRSFGASATRKSQTVAGVQGGITGPATVGVSRVWTGG